jgi:hypothetical protein
MKRWGLWDSHSDYGVAVRDKKELTNRGHKAKITTKGSGANKKHNVWLKTESQADIQKKLKKLHRK